MGVQFGKYDLVRKLATGGMAEIWLARQTGMQGFEKPVVIKRILSHLGSDQNFVKMFLDEARMAACLNHPNVVQIYDLGCIQGQYFIAMEYVDGVDVSTVLKTGRQKRLALRLKLTARIVSQACEGLHYAHFMKDMHGSSLNIVHRDVSPQNILISYNGAVKITDFGIAKARGRTTKTTTGTLKGKFGYMSYEQITGKGMDQRSDIFSLGVVLWEMLTYRRLFKRPNEAETIKAILLDEIPSPRKFWPNLPAEVERIAMKALEKNADQRYQTAHELASDLEKYLASQGLVVMPSEIAQFLRDLFPEKELDARKPRSASVVSAVAYREPQSDSASLPPSIVPVVDAIAGRTEAPGDAGARPGATADAGADAPLPIMPEEMEEYAEADGAAPGEGGQAGQSVMVEIGEMDRGPLEAAEAAPRTPPDMEKFEETTPVTAKKSKAWLVLVPLLFVVLAGGGYLAYTKLLSGTGAPPAPSAKAPAPSTSGTPLAAATAVETKPAQPEPHKPALSSVEEAPASAKAATDKEPPKKDAGKTARDQPVSKVEKQPVKTPAPAKAAEMPKAPEPPKPPPVAAATPAPLPPPPPAVPSVKESQPAGDGFLSLDSEPWAEVWSGGSKLGDTPLIKLKVPAGKLQLVLKNPDLGFEKRVTVAVAPDETASQSITIKKGVLNVRTDLPAEVYINKKKVGVTPLENYEIFEGSYKMRLVNREKEIERIIPLTIAPGQTKNISETLEK